MASDSGQTYTPNTNAILGIISPERFWNYPAVTLRFSLPEYYDTVKESDVMGLAGKTLLFTDTIMKPDIEYKENDSSNTWYSQIVADPGYNVKISQCYFFNVR